ncbi:Zn-dependent hydrolase [Amylibacter cionae]|nr:MBL fold metallo-hydrolase [Amylibacter cionae]PLS22412.1 Zn-dependent hydrolase [Amylibacter cionae]
MLISVFLAQTAAAQTRTPSHCLAFADNGPIVHRAALTFDQVQISYADHSMYVIDTYGGLRVVTDYNGYIGQTGKAPDVVTMNKGHSSHYTSHPDPQIPHVLRGWDPEGGVADHELELGEMLIRNVTTDIRSAYTGQEPDGNSIFIFEVAGLCIGHLGHLHHIPTDEQFARIGRLDVVMAAVDGSMTLDLPSMVTLLKRLRASVVLPMHWFSQSTLNRFVAGMRDSFEIVTLPDSSFVISQDLLPNRPTVMIVPPRFVTEYE